jgi:protoporphyrinogen oxidase
MRVAVIGAGMTGLVAAYRIGGHGHSCDVYERWPGLGGQVATLDVGGSQPLERYYHHLFTSDRHIASLYKELGMEDAIEWRPSTVAVFRDGRSHPFTSPLDLLGFRPLPLSSRIRMGLAVLWLQRRHRNVEPFENETARHWIERTMGHDAYETVWGPLLRGKFGDRAADVSMAWLWSKLTLRRRIKGTEARRELLGYPRGGWQPLLDRLAAEIQAHGGRVLVDRPAALIEPANGGYAIASGTPESFRRGHDPRRFDRAPAVESYDAVLATVPNDIFLRLLSEDLAGRLAPGYAERLRSIEYHSALCMLIELDRRFSPFYWTNIADATIPFVGLIEQTNFVPPQHYGGRRFLYVANYVTRHDRLLEHSPERLLARYEPGLRRINPQFSLDWVRRLWVFDEPAAQPIVTVGYRQRIPPLETGLPRLLLANTTQIYPEDRGTNYSVRLGTRAAEVLC